MNDPDSSRLTVVHGQTFKNVQKLPIPLENGQKKLKLSGKEKFDEEDSKSEHTICRANGKDQPAMSNKGISYTLAVCDENDSDMTSIASSPAIGRNVGDLPNDKVPDDDDVSVGFEVDESECNEDEHNEEAFGRYYGKPFLYLIRICCVVSVISVCMNTPQTFNNYPFLRCVTLVFDIVALIMLITEVVLKMRFQGFFYSKHSYLRCPGRLFELFIVMCILISIILQCFEWTSPHYKITSYNYLIVSFIRAPRPLVLLRVLKSMFNLDLPASNFSYRSMKQIWGILLFLVYFLVIFALIGGQLFGVMKYFCVKNNKTVHNINYSDFSIPIRRCPSTDMGEAGEKRKCPDGFKCIKLDFKEYRQNAEYFDNIIEGIITIYEAMSLEGWSTKMYESMDIVPFEIGGFIYFLLVFLLIGVLVRNVFIAIITEAFADLRVQLSKFTQVSSSRREAEDIQVLRKLDSNMKLVHVEEALVKSRYRRMLFKCVTSKPFLLCIHLVVFVDAIIQSFLSNEIKIYRPFQILFTILFNMEVILKVLAMGLKHYLLSETCLLEGFICLGSTILLPLVVVGYKEFAFIQVLRPFRLVLLWGSLRLFLRRILGKFWKLAQLSLFTLSVVFIAAGIFLQLFCGFGPQNNNGGDFLFDSFPKSFKAAFQIFMQEAWIDVMDDLVIVAGRNFAVLAYVFIMLFHFLAATVLVSVFVALILDNLELNEELKIVKQRRLGQEIADTTNELPLRIRIFEWFKAQPRVLNMDHVEYNVPKIRQNFVTTYLESVDIMYDKQFLISPNAYLNVQDCGNSEIFGTDSQLNFIRYSQIDQSNASKNIRKQSSFTKLMRDAHAKRVNFSNSRDETYGSKTMGYARLQSNRSTISTISNISNTPSFLEASLPGLTQRVNRMQSGIGNSSQISGYQSEQRMNDVDTNVLRQKREEAEHRKDMQIQNLRENHPKFDESLFIFSANGVLRKTIHRIVHARYRPVNQDDKGGKLGAFSIERFKRRYLPGQTYLEWIMTFTTQISLIGMISEFSVKQQRLFDSTNSNMIPLVTIEYIFIITSTVEILFKIIADGLLFAPEAFIRDFGDVLHLFIYIVSLIYVLWQPETIRPYSGAYWLLVFRCMRPIRLITLSVPLRNEFWKVVRGYKEFFKVFIFLFVIMFIFASYGVQTFGDQLRKCNDVNKTTPQDCVDYFEVQLAKPKLIKLLKGNMSILVPRVWNNPRNFDFDNMGNALLALLEMLSLEGWTEVRDVVEEVKPPFGSIYPHLYVFLTCLIVLTLFIGIVVNNFNESKGTALLTVEQKRWEDLKKKLELIGPLKLPPKPTENKKAYLYDILLSKMYRRIYCLLILINVSTLFLGQWHPTEFSDERSLSLDIVAMICCFSFIIDTLAKLYTFSVKGYFMSWGNRLDFILMLGGVIFILWNIPSCHSGYTGDASTPQCHHSKQFGVAIFILRFLTLSFKHNALQMLMLTIVMGLYKSFYTFCLLFVIMLCYGFSGIIFFGSVKRGLNLNAKVNFETFQNTFFLLTRIATGEDWNSLMRDAMVSEPYCRNEPLKYYWESNCGNKLIAVLFFHTYIILITYILLNVFIAVVIENFSIFYSTDSDPIMSQQDIQIFQTAWNLVDDDYSGTVSTQKAQVLLRLIYERLGLDKPLMLKRMCLEIKKTGKTNKVSFHNVLFVIAYRKIENLSKSLQLEERLAREELDNVILEEVAMETIRNWVIRVCANHRRKSFKPNFRRRVSGLSEGSTCSVISIDGSDYDPLSTSRHFHCNRSSASSSPTIRSAASSFDVPDGPSFPLKKRNKLSTEGNKDIKTEFYSWWDDEVEDGQ